MFQVNKIAKSEYSNKKAPNWCYALNKPAIFGVIKGLIRLYQKWTTTRYFRYFITLKITSTNERNRKRKIEVRLKSLDHCKIVRMSFPVLVWIQEQSENHSQVH